MNKPTMPEPISMKDYEKYDALVKKEAFKIIKEFVEEERPKAVAWDGCHKVYLLMDEAGVKWMKKNGFGQSDGDSVLWRVRSNTGITRIVDEASSMYAASCALSFVSAIYNDGEGNNDYVDVIDQEEELVIIED